MSKIQDQLVGPSNQTPGLIEPGNIIDLYNRPYTAEATGLDSKIRKGSRSSTYSASFGPDNRQVLLPTVVNGKFLTNDEAVNRYKQTGQHLGVFDSIDSANKYAQQLHESQQAQANMYGRNSGQPIRVRLKSGHAVEFPPGTDPQEAAKSMQNVAIALSGGADAAIRPRTISDDVRQVREKAGRFFAGALGIDYDKMQELQNSGISLAMLPFGPPSEAGQKLLNTPLVDAGDFEKYSQAGATQTPQIVDPEKFTYRRGTGFNSLLVDHNGHMIDLGGALHNDAMEALEPEIYNSYRELGGNTGHNSMAQALEKNKFIRVNYAPNNIGVEMYHSPSPHQIETLTQMYETAMGRSPKTLGSYDLYDGAKNVFKNGVAPADVLDKMFELYYGSK